MRHIVHDVRCGPVNDRYCGLCSYDSWDPDMAFNVGILKCGKFIPNPVQDTSPNHHISLEYLSVLDALF